MMYEPVASKYIWGSYVEEEESIFADFWRMIQTF